MIPVKTSLMNAIESALKNIPMIKQIKRGQMIPIDMDTAVYPWLCFFDEVESKKEKNRIMFKTFDLVIQVWVKKTDLSIDLQLDNIDAEIEATLLSDIKIAKNSIRIMPKESERFYVDDDETGILQSTYELTYAHRTKDPYDPVNGI